MGIIFLLSTIFIALAFSNIPKSSSFVHPYKGKEGFGSLKEGLVGPDVIKLMQDSIRKYLADDTTACEDFITKLKTNVSSRMTNTSDPDGGILVNIDNILKQNESQRPEFIVNMVGTLNRLPTALKTGQMDIAQTYAELLGKRIATAIIAFRGLYALDPGLNPAPPVQSDNPTLLAIVQAAATAPALPGSTDSSGKPNSSSTLIMDELTKASASTSTASTLATSDAMDAAKSAAAPPAAKPTAPPAAAKPTAPPAAAKPTAPPAAPPAATPAATTKT